MCGKLSLGEHSTLARGGSCASSCAVSSFHGVNAPATATFKLPASLNAGWGGCARKLV